MGISFTLYKKNTQKLHTTWPQSMILVKMWPQTAQNSCRGWGGCEDCVKIACRPAIWHGSYAQVIHRQAENPALLVDNLLVWKTGCIIMQYETACRE